MLQALLYYVLRSTLSFINTKVPATVVEWSKSCVRRPGYWYCCIAVACIVSLTAIYLPLDSSSGTFWSVEATILSRCYAQFERENRAGTVVRAANGKMTFFRLSYETKDTPRRSRRLWVLKYTLRGLLRLEPEKRGGIKAINKGFSKLWLELFLRYTRNCSLEGPKYFASGIFPWYWRTPQYDFQRGVVCIRNYILVAGGYYCCRWIREDMTIIE